MRFEVSQRIQTSASRNEIENALEEQFKKIASNVTWTGDGFRIKDIEASFGSINRTDVTTVRVNNTENGYLIIADVDYHPSVAFWIILLITLFTFIFWLIPIVFYAVQKKTVHTAIESVFGRINNEFQGVANKSNVSSSSSSSLDQLEKLAALKEKGIITEVEFAKKKQELLGNWLRF